MAEDAAQEACALAVEKWPAEGVPANPGAWLGVFFDPRLDPALAYQAALAVGMSAPERAFIERRRAAL